MTPEFLAARIPFCALWRPSGRLEEIAARAMHEFESKDREKPKPPKLVPKPPTTKRVVSLQAYREQKNILNLLSRESLPGRDAKRRLGISQGKWSYHIGALLAEGCVEKAGKVPVGCGNWRDSYRTTAKGRKLLEDVT